jgi:hypothetical protein
MARAAGEVGREGGREMIGVSVTLFADMRRYLPPGVDGPHRRVVPAGSRVADLLEVIGIPADADITVGVDGELADRATLLRDGADVMVLSPMEGGSSPPAEIVNEWRDGTPRDRSSAVLARSLKPKSAFFHNLTEETP